MLRRSLVLLALVTCVQPTEIVIEVSTNVSCDVVRANHVSIRLGHATDSLTAANANVATETDACDAGFIGTLVTTPSGARDEELGIAVVMGVTQATSACDVDASGCISARRALRYLPATPLRLPILLDVDCLGVSCAPNTTCANGFCVPVTSICDGSACVAPDAGVGVSCAPPDLVPTMPAPVLAWHFDEAAGATPRDEGNVLPPVVVLPTAWIAGQSGCGTALHLDGTFAVVLGDHPVFTNPAGMTVAFRIRTTDGLYSITRATSSSGFDMFDSCVDVYASTPDVDCPFGPLADGAWHQVSVSFTGNGTAPAKLRLRIDGLADQTFTGTVPWTPAQNVPLSFTSRFVGDIDDVLVFDKPL
jgi:hypothetical protein